VEFHQWIAIAVCPNATAIVYGGYCETQKEAAQRVHIQIEKWKEELIYTTITGTVIGGVFSKEKDGTVKKPESFCKIFGNDQGIITSWIARWKCRLHMMEFAFCNLQHLIIP